MASVTIPGPGVGSVVAVPANTAQNLAVLQSVANSILTLISESKFAGADFADGTPPTVPAGNTVRGLSQHRLDRHPP
jgi:hypothetical protein